MAKFCTKCGKKLVDGTCTCESVDTATKSVDVNGILDVVKGMFTKPVSTLKEFIQDSNFVSAMILLGVNIITIALFLCLSVKEVFGAMMGAFGGLGSLGMMSSSVEVPYMRIFFTTLISMAIVFAALAGLFYLVAGKLFKGNTSYKKMIALLGGTSVISTVTFLGSIILMYVSIQLMTLLLCSGMILQSVYTVQGFVSATDMDEDKVGYTYAIVYFVFLLVTLFILPGIMA